MYSRVKFPIKFKHVDFPRGQEPGAFGTVRKHDIHTGVDLYCEDGDEVVCVENGTVVAIEAFTGEHADSPWWNDTWAVLVEGEHGVICYGEIIPAEGLKIGDKLVYNQFIGNVRQVLKKDKGKNPPSMLHFELYTHGTRKTVWWHHGNEQPERLRNPVPLLNYLLSVHEYEQSKARANKNPSIME